MDRKEFKGILQLLIPSIINKITYEKKISQNDAITIFYNSMLYAKLEIETTKLWHLSVPTLIELLNQELTTGKITYPEEA